MDDWIDSTSLLAAAAEQGHKVSTRSLELWRYRGLLPRPRRQAKGRAAWLYPPGTQHQLLSLLHMHRKVRSLGLVTIALWVEDFPIELDRVRAALSSAVDELGRELHKAGGDIPGFIDLHARKLAGKRGDSGAPRIVRMTKDERIRACAYMIAVGLDAKEEIERRKDDIVLVERMFGLRSGHRGGLAMHEPFVAGFQRLKPILSLDKVRKAVASARPEEFELVRLVARLSRIWTPLMLPEMLNEYGTEAGSFRKIAGQTFDDPPVETYTLQIINHLLGLHESKSTVDEIRQAIGALQPAAIDLQMLTVFPSQKRLETFNQLPPDRQQQTKKELARRRKKSTGQQSSVDA